MDARMQGVVGRTYRVDLGAGAERIVSLMILGGVLVRVLLEQHCRLVQDAEHGDF